jgi:hypothetical protein
MGGHWRFRIPVLALLFGGSLSLAAAGAPPWAQVLGTNRIEADPGQEYLLVDRNGPWMIMACSFSGERAQQQAHELVLELRKRYKLPAYSHEVQFKLDDPNGHGSSPSPFLLQYETPDGRSRVTWRWQYKQLADHPELKREGALKEYAVLVGNYPAVDDPEARKDLQKVKSLDPDCLKVAGGDNEATPTVAGLRRFYDDIKRRLPGNENQHRGPMGRAIITTNPLLRSEYFAPKGTIDEMVLRMNRDVTHSLLDCPGRFTVRVAHFSGTMVFDQRQIDAIQAGRGELKSTLTKAAEQAHELTEALRMKGYEAYEFHDRFSSIVTVGSFESVGTEQPDGKVEINPRIHAIMKLFPTFQTVVGIPLDSQPLPVEVPKRSLSRELAERIDSARR